MTVKTKARTNGTDIGLSDKQLHGVSDILNRVLADQHVLYAKTRKYHWNVTGLQFYSLHELLEQHYTALAAASDEVAERARSLGRPAIGTLREFLDCATLEEQPGDYPDARQMLANLVADHQAVIRSLRQDVDDCAEKYHDMGTSDFLTALMEQHEKMAWMLRAFLEERADSA